MIRFGSKSHRQRTLAFIHLHAILPLLEEVAREDPEGRDIASRVEGAIQFSVLAGPSGCVLFTPQGVVVQQGSSPGAALGLFFPSCAHLNKAFQKRGLALAVPWKGFNRLGLLKNEFAVLSGRMEHYLRAEPEDLVEGPELALAVKLMLYAAVLAGKAVADHDPAGQAVVRELPRGVAEFRVAEVGIAAHFKAGPFGIEAVRGPAPDPDVEFEFSSLEVAHRFFRDKLDVMAAIPSGQIRLTGLIPLAEGLGHLMEGVSTYLE